MTPTEALHAADFVDGVLAPDAAASLLEAPLRLLDLRSLPDVDVARAREAAGRMASLPGVFVAVADGRPPPDHPLIRACTTVVGFEADHAGDAATISAGVAANPEAAVVLHQLLAVSEGAPFESGVVMESLAYSTLLGGAEHASWLRRGERPTRRQQSGAPTVGVDRVADALAIELRRPHVHNAFSSRMRDELCIALDVARADTSIRRIALSGAGPSFCSGGDLTEFGEARDPAAAHLVRTTRSVGLGIHALADREVEAHVHGSCVGAGVELAAFCHRVVAAPDTRFVLPEVAMGLVPGAGGTVSLPQRIGRHRTAWLALTGAAIDATTAQRWGLVDHVEPREGSR